MNNLKILFSQMTGVILLGLLIINFTSCSKDEAGSGGVPGGSLDLGVSTITVSGDINETFKGYADFELLDLGFVKSFGISLWDFDPSTFAVDLNGFGEAGKHPTPGTYIIESSPSFSGGYSGTFIRIENGNVFDAKEYNSQLILDKDGVAQDGTLTITSSSDKEIKGSFDFHAYIEDDEGRVTSTVRVQGDFTAKARIN